MTDYLTDPRVAECHGSYLVTRELGDRWQVTDDRGRTGWWAHPPASSEWPPLQQSRTAADAEAFWAERHERGPFATADEAIRSLIGDPR